MIQSLISNCGLPAGSNQLKPACIDRDDLVLSDSLGRVPNCSAMTALPLYSGGTVNVNLCEDDSAVIAMGAPAGWVHGRCPVTCGIPCLSTPVECDKASGIETCVHTSSNMPCEFNAGSGCVFSKDEDKNGRLQRSGADECASQTGTPWLYNKGIEGVIPPNVFDNMGHTQRLMMHMNRIQGKRSAAYARARSHMLRMNDMSA